MHEVTWERAFEALRAIRKLEHNWDSYGADPIPKIICDRVKVILTELEAARWEIPQVLPTPTGTIQLEWHANGRHEEWEIYVSRADSSD